MSSCVPSRSRATSDRIACCRLDFTEPFVRVMAPPPPRAGRAVANAFTATSTSSGSTTSAGDIRTTSAPASVASTPSPIMASTTSCATGRVSCTPSRSPRPRTSATSSGGDEARDLVAEPAAQLAGPRQQPLVLDGGEHREGGRARDRAAAERGAVLARSEREVGARDARTDRQAAAEPLRERHDVGHHVRMADRQPVAAPPEARLHLVGDQDRAVPVAPGARRAQELGRQRPHAALPQHRLQQHGADVAVAELALERAGRRSAARSGTSPRAARTAPASPAGRWRRGPRPCGRGTSPRGRRSPVARRRDRACARS